MPRIVVSSKDTEDKTDPVVALPEYKVGGDGLEAACIEGDW